MDPALTARPWVPPASERLVHSVASTTADLAASDVLAELDRLVTWNDTIHNVESVNLNPATNVMNPRAEAMLSAKLGSRPSLGYPGEKYEMGLEAIERIEIIAAELAAEVFGARYAEVRVGSGALANLYAFMATCTPGDTIIAPPAAIGGHITHHEPGAAGRYGLTTVAAPVSADDYTVDVEELRCLVHDVRPRLITTGRCGARDRRRGRRVRALRRRARLRGHRRTRVGLAAAPRRPSDDDEHVQEPGRSGRRIDRHR